MDKVERLVVFSIFMENGQGITGKAPDYILEKWQIANLKTSADYIIACLDAMNQAKFREWQRIWRRPRALQTEYPTPVGTEPVDEASGKT